MRSDTRRNLRRMRAAASELLMESPDSTSMTDIAAKAEIGIATAYRYYSSMEQLVEAIVLDIIEDLRDYSVGLSSTGGAQFRQVLLHWIELVKKHGPILIQLRSRRGYLDRLHADNPVIATVAEAWRAPLQGLLGAEVEDSRDFDMAMMLLNLLVDPREVDELIHRVGLPAEQVATMMTATFTASVGPWLASYRLARPLEVQA